MHIKANMFEVRAPNQKPANNAVGTSYLHVVLEYTSWSKILKVVDCDFQVFVFKDSD